MLSERYEKILGKNFEPRFDPNLWSIRVNTLKISVEEMKEEFSGKYEMEQIPWIREGFWIKTEDILTKTAEYSNGHFFSQNASSMIPPLVLDPKEGEKILDVSAAPGSKTTQMAAMMKNDGKIIANDVSRSRIKALKTNLKMCGVTNTVVMQHRGEIFWKTGLKVRKILLDAPCTGTGTMNPRILRQTSLSSIKRMSKLQKKILLSMKKCLQENGIIVYSTCSLEPEENEAVADFAVRKLDLSVEKINLEIPEEFLVQPILNWDGKKFDESVKNCLRVVPTEKTEGLFVCKLRKNR